MLRQVGKRVLSENPAESRLAGLDAIKELTPSALGDAGVLTEDDEGWFALTPIGDCLRAGAPGSMRAAALLFGGNFSAVRHLVDVGGGNGALLAGILKAHPSLKATLFDLPQVVDRARPRLNELGLADRCEAVGGDFFAEVPGRADAYLLKHVIHDWDDERASAILQNCRRAMPPAGKLLIVEGVYPPRIDQSEASRGAAANDVNMLVCTGGRQRSEAEFRSLYVATGFTLSRIIPTDLAFASIIEGVPQ